MGHFAQQFGGRAGDTLQAWRAAGKDKLLIAPSGPFHFYPAHLVHVDGAPLADAWKIAYLPNIGLLSRQLEPRARDVPLTSIGLDYANDPGRPTLRGAVAEATRCAALFGTDPVLNSAATKDRVPTALRSSRYVHIAAHGEHNVDAPAFQVVHLTEGGLFAHELLTEDLTGLELVTLSACETGLGRIDRGDNLRGIPAALLPAGVRHIVATMWPIFDQAASCFFGCLYKKIADGNTVLDAFYTAQHHTRTCFPQYRDWGAFALMGIS
jgi:CHAT domain-containing protein